MRSTTSMTEGSLFL
ncbi:BgTH12-06023 [Blumeria graminis f. sp. triticale]|uniref:BgTH12-06023 n=1 Tax=Blumeria graminis f. sp. triticale TaxID=1689686 RepID=A0A9W4GHW2_BLUGR|nr:BgTH12-06023 [Blumeria graminis f. sp. triticale]